MFIFLFARVKWCIFSPLYFSCFSSNEVYLYTFMCPNGSRAESHVLAFTCAFYCQVIRHPLSFICSSFELWPVPLSGMLQFSLLYIHAFFSPFVLSFDATMIRSLLCAPHLNRDDWISIVQTPHLPNQKKKKEKKEDNFFWLIFLFHGKPSPKMQIT